MHVGPKQVGAYVLCKAKVIQLSARHKLVVVVHCTRNNNAFIRSL